ncbi:MAG: hypothetical protein AAGH38_03785 [Pseudomonadota bacterium]
MSEQQRTIQIDDVDVVDTAPTADTIVERRHDPGSRLERFKRSLTDAAGSTIRIIGFAALLLPFLVTSFLLLDIPVRAFDRFFSDPTIAPGRWFSLGDALLIIPAMVCVFIARRSGGDDAARAVTVAWAAAAMAALVGVIYLAPELQAGDLPSARFSAVFVFSWMVGQYTTIGLYDVLRGGSSWWRAPLYSLMAGYLVGSALLFPLFYFGSNAPWMAWLTIDFAIKAGASFLFLGGYWLLMSRVRPATGYGR